MANGGKRRRIKAKLTKPASAYAPKQFGLLDDLQANILKSHGRQYVRLLFFRFALREDASSTDNRAQDLAAILGSVATSAFDQLDACEVRKRVKAYQGPPVVGVCFTHQGMVRLGKIDNHSLAFAHGMRARLDWLKFRSPELSQSIDGMIMLADGQSGEESIRIHHLESWIRQSIHRHGGAVVRAETGRGLKRRGLAVEHFGYVDGISQPRMTQRDIDAEAVIGSDAWSTQADPSLAVGACDGVVGSYLAYQKLEQHPATFLKQDEGARRQAVGRYEDGTPVHFSDRIRDLKPPPNNFRFPRKRAMSHIEAVNPRSSRAEYLWTSFPRRGIPYDDRRRTEARYPSPGQAPSYPNEYDLDYAPDDQVGLHFIAYNRSLEDQFEAAWQRMRRNGDPIMDSDQGFVTPIWGEYFFVPVKSFLTRGP